MLSGRSVTYSKVNFRNMQPNKRQQKRVIAEAHCRKIVPSSIASRELETDTD